MPRFSEQMGKNFTELARGTQKEVYTDNRDPKKRFVHAEYKDKEHYPEWFKSPNFIKAQFYLNKLFHLFLPHNIPEMHMASTEPRQEVADRIDMDGDHKKLTRLRYAEDTEPREFDEPIGGIEERMKEKYGKKIDEFKEALTSIAGEIDIDSMIQNYGLDKGGNLVYVDSIYPWGVREDEKSVDQANRGFLSFNFDLNKIRNSVAAIGDPVFTEKAGLYLDKILALASDECKARGIKINNNMSN